MWFEKECSHDSHEAHMATLVELVEHITSGTYRTSSVLCYVGSLSPGK